MTTLVYDPCVCTRITRTRENMQVLQHMLLDLLSGKIEYSEPRVRALHEAIAKLNETIINI